MCARQSAKLLKPVRQVPHPWQGPYLCLCLLGCSGGAGSRAFPDPDSVRNHRKLKWQWLHYAPHAMLRYEPADTPWLPIALADGGSAVEILVRNWMLVLVQSSLKKLSKQQNGIPSGAVHDNNNDSIYLDKLFSIARQALLHLQAPSRVI
jgi:hypothetical protein